MAEVCVADRVRSMEVLIASGELLLSKVDTSSSTSEMMIASSALLPDCAKVVVCVLPADCSTAGDTAVIPLEEVV